MTIPSLHLVLCPECGLEMAILMILQKRKEVYSFRKSLLSVNRQYTFHEVISEVSSFAGNPVCQEDSFIIVYNVNPTNCSSI